MVSERSPDRISKSIISGKQLRKIPGTSGDPLKGLQALPGVVASGGGQQPAVRGSGANENAYYVDDLPIGKIFYFQGISVFNADLISDFNLYSAAFSPHYKDVTGAVFDVALRSPRTDRLRYQAQCERTGCGCAGRRPGQPESIVLHGCTPQLCRPAGRNRSRRTTSPSRCPTTTTTRVNTSGNWATPTS